MHTLDIAIIIIGLILTFVGIKRGLIGEVVRLLAMIVGFIFAFLYFREAYHIVPFLDKLPRSIGNAVAFTLVYVGTAVIILLAGWAVSKIVHLSPLGWIDRILGAVIGILKAALIAWVICLSLSSFPAKKVQSGLNRSLVYRTYKQLPHQLLLPSLMKFRMNIKRLIERDTPQKLDSMQQKLETFKDVVDSAKNAQKL